VLEEGMEPKPLTLTAEEAQYIETRKLNREEVCAAYDMPPPVVHILDRATFSNITEQMRSMYRDTMARTSRASRRRSSGTCGRSSGRTTTSTPSS
jgi:phage portal protein BeeE